MIMGSSGAFLQQIGPNAKPTRPITIPLVRAGLRSASDPLEAAKNLAGNAAKGKVEQEVNTRLLAEGRKNQCSFKTDSDELRRAATRS